MNKVLILGATSAIAHETAKLFAREGAQLFLVGRNPEKLETVCQDLKVRGAKQVESLVLDLSDNSRHAELVSKAISALDGLDAVLIAHGTLSDQKAGEASVEVALREFNNNCVSVISLLTILANHFEKQKRGCIAVISSVAGDRGRQSNYVYGAAKGGVNTFLQGLRNRLAKSGVAVLTIKPGFVDTPMTAHLKKGLLFANAGKVGGDIFSAMQKGKDVLYTPRFWQLIMLIIKHVPEPVFKRLKL
ncbi:MAG: SDR family oxidoreductase [Chloroflexi bacterium]|uniref:SDR family oxidoreductase n=1 Tax=Candidatus Chlorohelix allophototropha TaxID=3003348 RepID=A0A8T7M8L6_9CHLR|nr:SDR family oxidoreductase [Chloroflexota bacterium]WJW68441.1 SDR family oxidoreductase [Chloroflexota bacterium L227-S17]